MPNIINEIKLDFKDVLLRPKRSTLKSRSDVSIDYFYFFLIFSTFYANFFVTPKINFFNENLLILIIMGGFGFEFVCQKRVLIKLLNFTLELNLNNCKFIYIGIGIAGRYIFNLLKIIIPVSIYLFKIFRNN